MAIDNAILLKRWNYIISIAVNASIRGMNVGAANSIKNHFEDDALQDIAITQSGYLYVYCSNESPVSVFFDNLQVVHTRGRLLEESHYYPYGLAMAGISHKGAMVMANQFKFNGGVELNTAFDINLYETTFRGYDPQIGRFHQIDPLSGKFPEWSPYSFAFNNPIGLNDPMGAEPVKPKEWIQKQINSEKYGKLGRDNESKSNIGVILEKLVEDMNAKELWGTEGVPTYEAFQKVVGDFYDGKLLEDFTKTGYKKSNAEPYDWGNAKATLDFTGGIFGGLETAVRPGDQWLGKNGKYYNMSWGGNQYAGGRSGAIKSANIYKRAGIGAIVATAAIGSVETFNGYKMDGGQFGYNANSAVAKTIGGIGGGGAGAAFGTKIGGAFGALFGGLGAIPGAIAGGFIGGWFGGELGGYGGQGSVNWYYGR